MPTMSKSDYARLCDVSRQLIHERIRHLEVVGEEDGSIDPAKPANKNFRSRKILETVGEQLAHNLVKPGWAFLTIQHKGRRKALVAYPPHRLDDCEVFRLASFDGSRVRDEGIAVFDGAEYRCSLWINSDAPPEWLETE